MLRDRGHRALRAYRRGAEPIDDATVRLTALTGETALRQLTGADLGVPALFALLHRERPDIVHVHDHVFAWGPRAVLAIAARWPTVITLHDFTGVSGGCLVPRGCERYAVGCGECPALGRDAMPLRVDRTRTTWNLNATLAASPRVRAVAPSRFLADRAREGAWRSGDVRVIANMVDGTRFVERDRVETRRQYGVKPHETVAMFVAGRLDDTNKGAHLLPTAIAEMPADERPNHVWVVGEGELPFDRGALGAPLKMFGSLREASALAALYSAADLTVIPSETESFGLVSAESQSCGTPVVVTSAGGLPETVRDGISGVVARSRTPAALAAAMRRALAELRGDATRRATADWARSEFASGRFLSAHESVYAALQRESRRSGAAATRAR